MLLRYNIYHSATGIKFDVDFVSSVEANEYLSALCLDPIDYEILPLFLDEKRYLYL